MTLLNKRLLLTVLRAAAEARGVRRAEMAAAADAHQSHLTGRPRRLAVTLSPSYPQRDPEVDLHVTQ